MVEGLSSTIHIVGTVATCALGLCAWLGLAEDKPRYILDIGTAIAVVLTVLGLMGIWL